MPTAAAKEEEEEEDDFEYSEDSEEDDDTRRARIKRRMEVSVNTADSPPYAVSHQITVNTRPAGCPLPGRVIIAPTACKPTFLSLTLTFLSLKLTFLSLAFISI